jgi:hypothetical protein
VVTLQFGACRATTDENDSSVGALTLNPQFTAPLSTTVAYTRVTLPSGEYAPQPPLPVMVEFTMTTWSGALTPK